MEFVACGNSNIRATHKTTIELTKDKELSLKGDCIIGVNAGFNINSLKRFVRENKDKKIRIIFSVDNLKEEIIAELNPVFSDHKELVIRKSDFISKRTFAIKANKAACDLDRKLVSLMKDPDKMIKIQIKP